MQALGALEGAHERRLVFRGEKALALHGRGGRLFLFWRRLCPACPSLTFHSNFSVTNRPVDFLFGRDPPPCIWGSPSCRGSGHHHTSVTLCRERGDGAAKGHPQETGSSRGDQKPTHSVVSRQALSHTICFARPKEPNPTPSCCTHSTVCRRTHQGKDRCSKVTSVDVILSPKAHGSRHLTELPSPMGVCRSASLRRIGKSRQLRSTR